MHFSYLIAVVSLASQASASGLFSRQGAPSSTSGGIANRLPQIPAACSPSCTALSNLETTCQLEIANNSTAAETPASFNCICGQLATNDLSACFGCIANATSSTPLSADQIQEAVTVENQSLTLACALSPPNATSSAAETSSSAAASSATGTSPATATSPATGTSPGTTTSSATTTSPASTTTPPAAGSSGGIRTELVHGSALLAIVGVLSAAFL